MATYECGCGSESAREFLPGHDQKLRAKLEANVGGILALRALVDASADYARGKTSEQAFTQAVQSIMFKASGR